MGDRILQIAICIGFLLTNAMHIEKAYSQNSYVPGSPQLAYWRIGQGEPIVIVLHGGPAAQHEYLRPEFDSMAKFASVIYYDQRGCGKSEKAKSYYWQAHVEDLKRLIRITAGKKRVYLAGSSWGSTLALIYAYKHPEDVKGLILSGTYEWEGKGKIYKSDRFYYPSGPSKQTLYEQSLVVRQTVDGNFVEEIVDIKREFDFYAGAPAFETRHSFISAPVADSLQLIKTPVLIINGSRNGKGCWPDWVDHYLKLLPNCELFTIRQACHDPWISNPQKFFERCRVFIEDNNLRR